MRTLVLIIGMLAIVGGGFYFIALRGRPDMVGTTSDAKPGATTRSGNIGSAVPPKPQPIAASVPSTPNPNAGIIGQSSNVFVESRDPRSGRITHKFRALALDPHRDGTVGVTKPEVRFYGKDHGGVIVLEGSGGTVTTSTGGNPDDPRSIGASTPTNGQLNDVTLRFYEEPRDPALANDEEKLLATSPTITVKIPAVKFDALSNRIATFDGVIDGKPVPAERMPVTVRGRDFELDGQGLTMSWNDRTGRLDQLVIERGERLLVTDVNRFGGSSLLSLSPLPDGTPLAAMRSLGFSPANVFSGLVLAEPSTAATAKAAAVKDLYHVTFDHDVKVLRSGTQVAAADVMNVAMLLGEKKDDAQPTTKPKSRNRRKAPSTNTTRPADPVEVHWTGKLTVRPAEADMTGQTVELVGAPAWVRENGSEASGATIRVEPEVGRLRIAPGNGVEQVRVRDASGGELKATSVLSVDKDAGRIVIDGPGSLNVPPTVTPAINSGTTQPSTRPASTQPAQPTLVNWTRRLQIDIDQPEDAADANARQYLKQITIEGDADVRSAQMTATAQTLTLAFSEPSPDAPATKPSSANKSADENFAMPAADFSRLRMVEAEGAAKLVTVDARTGKQQSLDAQRVRISLKPGADGPLMTALAGDGGVALRNADGSSLDCGSLNVQMEPRAVRAGENPFDQIRRLVAKDHVKLTQPDGTHAVADRVESSGERGDRRLKLIGEPAEVATAKGSLRGNTIDLDPDTGSVNVPGPGAFVGAGDPRTGKGAMALGWTGSMSADSKAGVCTLQEGVNVDGTDAHGTRLKTKAGSAVIKFETSQADATTRPAGDSALAKVSVDSIRSLSLADVDAISMITADGRRESTIETRTLDIDLVAGTLNAPQPGRMLLVSRSAAPTSQPTTGPTTQATEATTQPAVADDDDANRGNGGFGPGSLALMWQGSMNWQMRSGDLTMLDGVRLGFEKENSDDPIRLNATQLKCTLVPIDPTPKKDDAAAATGVDQVAQRLELKTINALGNVSVRSKLMSLNAGTLSYELATDQATASADDQTQLQVFNADGTSQVGFSSFVWNVNTGQGEFRDVGARMRR